MSYQIKREQLSAWLLCVLIVLLGEWKKKRKKKEDTDSAWSMN